MKKSLLFIVGLAMVGLLQAAAPITALYAYGYDIQSESAGPVLRLSLDHVVYQGVYHSDLKDMVVINQDGQAIPFLIRNAASKTSQSRKQLSLPFYPLYLNNNADMKHIQVSTQSDGTIINIISPTGNGAATQRYYIIDASQVEQGTLEQIHLQWQQGEGTQLIETHLEASDDLQHWQAVGDLVFSSLQFADYQLLKDSAQLDQKIKKYYRLSWPSDEIGAISSVHIDVIQTQANATLMEMMGRKATMQYDNIYVYDLGGYMPVELINVKPIPDNSVAEVRLSSRNKETDPWQHRATTIIYRLRIGDRLLQNDPLRISPQAARYWQVEVIGKNYLNESPLLEPQWQAQQLLILAQGKGPYRLLFGRSDQGESQADEVVQQLLQLNQSQDAVHEARLVNYREYCGTPCVMPVAEATDWTRYVLWLVIITGVAGLAWMSVVLWREMNKPAS